MTQTTAQSWPTATRHAGAYACDACGLMDLRPYKGYYRETSGSDYVPGRRYAHQAHTPDRCAARVAYNERRAAEYAERRRADRTARLLVRYVRVFIVPAVQSGAITSAQASDLYNAAAARWA
jgi:hypothetical protein